ncbi:MAG: tetratricopeptide repeat protein [Nannocystaceae bacterium]|nr:tetratricopeptide repeat protein [Nannocystaceae bacterium]
MTEATVGQVIGTVPYMAPEQQGGRSVDARADQYAFCSALWEALDGALPFASQTQSFASLLDAKRNGVGARRPRGAPGWLVSALRRGLAPQPEERFASMDALLAALRRGRRYWRGVGALGAVAVLTMWGTTRSDVCHPEILVFSGAPDVAQAFKATGLAVASEQAERVTARLVAYASEWSDAHRSVCIGPRRWPRLECLAQGRAGFETLVEVLSHATRSDVGNAWSAVSSLPVPDACLTTQSTQEASIAAPKIWEDLERARVLQRAGRLEAALALARRADRNAAAQGPALRAHTSFRVGRILLLSQQPQHALEQLEHAFFAARAAGDSGMASAAAIQVANAAQIVATDEVVVQWLRHAEAELERAGNPPGHRVALLTARGNRSSERGDLEAALIDFDEALELSQDETQRISLLTNRGLTHLRHGDLIVAEADLRRSLEAQIALRGADDARLAGVLNNLALVLWDRGELDEAERFLQQTHALAVSSAGMASPDALRALLNLGLLAFDREDYDNAARLARTVRDARIDAFGPEHRSVFVPTLNLGNALLALGQVENAISEYRTALEIVAQDHGPEHPRAAYVLTGLGAALRQAGRGREAREVLTQATKIRDTTGASVELRIETWAEFARALHAAGASNTELDAALGVLQTLYAQIDPQRDAEQQALLSELGRAIRMQKRIGRR